MAKRPPRQGESTRAVHGGEREHQATQAVPTPIYQTSTFHFESSQEVVDYQEGRRPRDEYGRYGNPTWRAVERKLSALEGARVDGELETVLFASGMCAATTSFLALLPEGSHLVVTSDCYRRTRQFFRQYLGRMGVELSVIEPADTKKLAEAIRDETELFFTESPTNPFLRVVDVPEVVRVCHARGVRVMMDSTFATPVNQTTLEYGADLVIHSATKYLGGHNDLLAGTVTGRPESLRPVRQAAGVLGGVIDPHAAWLLLRGMKTLGIRMARHNENGLRVAQWLERHPKVRRVWYPGLESHPDHDVAREQMRGFGGVVTFELDADLKGAMRFIDATRLPYQAPSLGGVESLIELPVTMSYWDHTPEERESFGIVDSLVRLSCGVEDTPDLIADLESALESV
jgi:cystathionine beta-lyase/cystathionine gamma-synthase